MENVVNVRYSFIVNSLHLFSLWHKIHWLSISVSLINDDAQFILIYLGFVFVLTVPSNDVSEYKMTERLTEQVRRRERERDGCACE